MKMAFGGENHLLATDFLVGNSVEFGSSRLISHKGCLVVLSHLICFEMEQSVLDVELATPLSCKSLFLVLQVRGHTGKLSADDLESDKKSFSFFSLESQLLFSFVNVSVASQQTALISVFLEPFSGFSW